MIARWMMGAVLFSAFVALAALASERALRALARPTRVPWVLAILATVSWPLLAPWLLTTPVSDPAFGAIGDATPVGGVLVTPTAFTTLVDRVMTWTMRADPLWLALWAVASVVLLAQLLLALRTLQRVKSRARVAEIDGEPVLVDAALGPAVVGVLEPRIVIPAWLLELDPSLRALVLRHEREHCRSGDPALVWLSAISTTVFPWNPALWWMSRRLRASMEIDCDARTIQSDDDRSRYAKLLLLMAHHAMHARFVPMMFTSTTQLSRRISAMQQRTRKYPALRALGALSVACAAVAAACSPRIAANLTSPTPVENKSPAVAAVAEPAKPTVATPPYFDFQVERPATVAAGTRGPSYPDSLRAAGVNGEVLAQFVVNTDGSVDLGTFKVLRSTHAEFSEAVRASLATLRFTPALVGDRAVRQLVQTPFTFSLDRTSGTAPSDPATGDTGRRGQTLPVMASPVASPSSQALLSNPANKPARAAAGSKGPQYPQELRDAKVEGQVMVQFIVNADGTADMATLKVLKSDHALFTQAVREALSQMKFEPAQVDGRAVRQLMQSPFVFSLSR